MASIDFVIRLLEAIEYNGSHANETPVKCACAAEILNTHRNRYATEVSNAILSELQTSLEVSRFPEIASNLYTTLYYKLTHSETEFVEISGFRLDERDCRMYATIPELRSLGTYSDWKSMQEAGWDLFDTKGKAKTPQQRAAGWYFHYTNFLSGRKGAEVYPTIMRARLNWASGRRLAPYWYWYDTDVSTKYGTPTQQPLDLRGIIRTYTERYIQDINSACALREESFYSEFSISDLERQIDNYYNNEDFSRPEPTISIRYGGTYKGRKISEDEILNLISSGEISISRQYTLPNGDIMINYQETNRRKFTGLYQRITRI